jgi:hypothetical protein
MRPAAAFAITGVVKNQRSDAVGGEKLLHAEPLLHGFANAMTKQDCGACGTSSRLNKNGVKKMIRTAKVVTRSTVMNSRGDAAAFRPPERAIAKNQEPASERKGKRKGNAVQVIRRTLPDSRRFAGAHAFLRLFRH